MQDHKHSVDTDSITHAKREFGYDGDLFVNDDFRKYADAVCNDIDKSYPPTTYEDALELYFFLLQDCDINLSIMHM